MQDNTNNSDYEKCIEAAQKTVDLIDHSHTPDEISDVVLERLIEMSAESRIMIWHDKTGLRIESLTALYSLYERGAGYRRSRVYGRYEAKRIKGQSKNNGNP
jgi:hypothetical protein